MITPAPSPRSQLERSQTPVTDKNDLGWTDLDRRAVDTIRVLAMDAVEKVGPVV